jgi:hypothetical protein
MTHYGVRVVDATTGKTTTTDRCTWGCVDPAFPDGVMLHFQERVYNSVVSEHVTNMLQHMCSNLHCLNDVRWIQSWGTYVDEGCLGFADVQLCDHCYQQLDDWEKGHMCSTPAPATLPKVNEKKKEENEEVKEEQAKTLT